MVRREFYMSRRPEFVWALSARFRVARTTGFKGEREFFIDDQLVRIHLIMSEMFLVDRPRAMGV